MDETVEIVKLGSQGDGAATDGLFVPYTVPGDIVRVERGGARGRILEVLTPGLTRVAAPCRHFGTCGGCALQHVEKEAYLSFKRDLVIAALQQRGFDNPPVEPIRPVPSNTRRRASFKAKRTGQGVLLGFYESESRNLVDLGECPVLTPSLAKLMGKMRQRLLALLRPGETAELLTTSADNGIDVSLKLKRARDMEFLVALGDFAVKLNLGRLSWNGETIATALAPELCVGNFRIKLPVDAFLQPTREGESILQDLVRGETGKASRFADLFSGCGTFTFVLAEKCSVHAADSEAAHIAALQAAARTGRGRVTSEPRDLFRRPFAPEELTGFDAVLLDPPRVGAKAQVESLARSQVGRILYVSCNPASFARDARILVDGGYGLRRVVPVDQFLWSPHVEIFSVFSRS
jgi:23S rRNA (uracil1939-C5)-methyltransferase